MDQVSVDPRARARKAAALVLQRVQRETTQAAIAAAMGVSEATISRALSEHLERMMLILAHAGIKCVPAELKCYPADEIQALITLARVRMQQVDKPDKLLWDDET